MSLPRADIFPDFIAFTSPQKLSTDPNPSIFEATLQDTTPRTLVYGKEYFLCHR